MTTCLKCGTYVPEPGFASDQELHAESDCIRLLAARVRVKELQIKLDAGERAYLDIMTERNEQLAAATARVKELEESAVRSIRERMPYALLDAAPKPTR